MSVGDSTTTDISRVIAEGDVGQSAQDWTARTDEQPASPIAGRVVMKGHICKC